MIRALLQEMSQPLSGAGRALRQHRVAAGPDGRHRHSCRRRWHGSSAAAVTSAAPPAEASMRDAAPGYPPYDVLQFDVPVLEEGDVDARVWIRIREVEQSMALIDQILQRLPPGPIAAAIAALCRDARARRHGARGRISRRRAGLGQDGSRRQHRALPFARSLVVPMAGARGGDRRQHRGGLPSVQQVVQLLVLRP